MIKRRAATVLTAATVLVLGLCQSGLAYLHPEAGRFLQRDPLGHVDGANTYGYESASPIGGLDPTGMLKITVDNNDLGNKKCGDTPSISWHFELGNPAPCDGYIVQEVKYYCSIKRCSLNECPLTTPVQPGRTYYEAWFVSKGGTKVVDTAGLTTELDHCGAARQEGEVKFYCENENDPAANGVGTGNLRGKWPKGPLFDRGSKCRISPIKLNATSERPDWWYGTPVEGPAHREFSVEWDDCCPSCTVTASARPS